ncbi:hypothetical protein ANCDUO_25544, partial [Ancylostoma duodenale]
RTGANLKGMTETVISAPLELAQRLKSTFGSADNVNEPGEGTNSDLRIGHSKFYASSDYGSPSQATTSRYASRKSDSLPAHASLLKTSTPVRCRVNDSDTSALVDDSELVKGDRGEQASDSLLLSPFALSAESSEMPPQLLDDLRGLRYLMTKMGDQINRIETRLDTELAYVTRALEEEREAGNHHE